MVREEVIGKTGKSEDERVDELQLELNNFAEIHCFGNLFVNFNSPFKYVFLKNQGEVGLKKSK